jgi:hypothetical protein
MDLRPIAIGARRGPGQLPEHRREVALAGEAAAQRDLVGSGRSRMGSACRWRRLAPRIADGAVPAQPPLEHPEQHRHVAVDVVEDANLGLAWMEAVEAARVLDQRPLPRHRQRQDTNPAESLDPPTDDSASVMQAETSLHKDFGQPVVSDSSIEPQQGGDDRLLTPAQAAARFQVPEYLLRKTCAEGHLEHLRVVNAVWLSPAAVESFARSWRAQKLNVEIK